MHIYVHTRIYTIYIFSTRLLPRRRRCASFRAPQCGPRPKMNIYIRTYVYMYILYTCIYVYIYVYIYCTRLLPRCRRCACHSATQRGSRPTTNIYMRMCVYISYIHVYIYIQYISFARACPLAIADTLAIERRSAAFAQRQIYIRTYVYMHIIYTCIYVYIYVIYILHAPPHAPSPTRQPSNAAAPPSPRDERRKSVRG